MKSAYEELRRVAGPDFMRLVASQIVEHGCLHDETYAEIERVVVRAQSPFWDIVIDHGRSQRDRDLADSRMLELADLRRGFRMWTVEGLERQRDLHR